VILGTLLVLNAAAGAAAAPRPLDVRASSVSGNPAAADLFDPADLARRVLAQHWKTLDPRQQEEFVRLFRDVVAHSLTRIRARMTSERESPMTIEYRRSRSNAQWTVYDIVVDGVSLVSSYRSQLNDILRTSSVAELLEHMRTEAARRPLSGEAAENAMAADLELVRERLIAGLLLGAVSRGRWAR
jgi:MlaC protein